MVGSSRATVTPRFRQTSTTSGDKIYAKPFVGVCVHLPHNKSLPACACRFLKCSHSLSVISNGRVQGVAFVRDPAGLPFRMSSSLD